MWAAAACPDVASLAITRCRFLNGFLSRKCYLQTSQNLLGSYWCRCDLLKKCFSEDEGPVRFHPTVRYDRPRFEFPFPQAPL